MNMKTIEQALRQLNGAIQWTVLLSVFNFTLNMIILAIILGVIPT